jgi:hypothetical protein
MPAERVEEVLRRAAETRSIDEVSDVGSWSSYRQFLATSIFVCTPTDPQVDSAAE